MIADNKNFEQLVKDKIDKTLSESGWLLQSKPEINLTANIGVVVRELQTHQGFAEYLLFVNKNLLALLKQRMKKKA